MTRRAAEALVETLKLHGVDRIFCVPGESYIAVLDALHDEPSIHVVTCRHEGGAGFMAVADAKMTGRAGTCFVSRGPGATNASIAVHAADYDAAPLVLFVGQVERKDFGRKAFQEVDYAKTFSDMAKWVEQVNHGDKLPEAVARAYSIAESGTPGPVVVVLPEDMLEDETSAPAEAPRVQSAPVPAETDLSAIADRLAQASRPVMIVGGGADTGHGRRALLAAAHAWALPVATSFKRQDMFPNDHPNYAGHLGYGIPGALGNALREADLILAVGTRLDDTTSQGFTLPAPGQALIHVHRDPAQIGRNFRTEIGIAADPASFLAALSERNSPPPKEGRAQWLQRLHQVHVDLAEWEPSDAEDGVDFGHMIAAMNDILADDAVITMDGGNFSSWCHRYFDFKPTHKLIACITGAMGMGVPSAIAAALREPNRPVVTLIGDGGMLMTGAELATAVQENANVNLIVSNNGAYGTIRTHQERKYPRRTKATALKNPDFAAMADAFGATGIVVDAPEKALPALRQAIDTPGPVVIDVRSSLEHISAYTSISALRGA
jgi:acetolactate synthase-1/2/3 large subunit